MIRCTHCGNSETFAIEAVTHVTAYVTQRQMDSEDGAAGDLELDGTSPARDTAWSEDAACRCLRCQTTAPLATLEVPGPVVAIHHDVF